jgi:hypothetical protein
LKLSAVIDVNANAPPAVSNVAGATERPPLVEVNAVIIL